MQKFNIRFATLEDVDKILIMGLKFLADSPYSHMEVDPEEIVQTIEHYIQADKREKIILLTTKDDKITGMLVAQVSKHLLNKSLIASEVLWWMDPEDRGGRDAIKLVEAFEFWAHKLGAKHIQLSNHISSQTDKINKFYNKRNYYMVEQNFVKDI